MTLASGKVYVGSVSGWREIGTALNWATTAADDEPLARVSSEVQTITFTTGPIPLHVWRLFFGGPVPRWVRHPDMDRRRSVPVKPSAARRGRTHRRKR